MNRYKPEILAELQMLVEHTGRNLGQIYNNFVFLSYLCHL